MSNQAGYFYAFGPYHLDPRKRVLLRDGQPVPLPPKAVETLAVLVENAGNLVEKSELIGKVWPDAFVEEGNLSKNIYILRHLLGSGVDGRDYIETVPRRGYRFIAEVGEVPPPLPRLTINDIRPLDREMAAAPGGPSVIEPLPASRSSFASVRAGEMGGAASLAAGARAQPEMRLDLNAADQRDVPRQALESAIEGVIETHTSRLRWRRWVVGLAIAIVALGIAFALYLVRRPPPAPEVIAFNRLTNDGRQKLVSVELGSPILTDGLRLYFMEWMGERAVPVQVSVDGGDPAPINSPSPLAQLAGISPGRSELLVAGFTATEADAPLWLVPVPGGTPRRLGDLTGHDGTWSRDGRRLVYAKGYGLYVARPDGSESRQLASLSGMAYWPRWSPDGRVLRFTLNDPKTDSDSLWEVSTDGSGLHPLFPYANAPPNACCGDWTADGLYFIFESSDGGKTNIWTLREKGGLYQRARREPSPLTAGPMNFAGPAPSLDGKQLFAVGAQRRGELVRYNSKLKSFAPYLSGISAEGTDFSRDGAWVAYSAYPEATLWRSRIDGIERLQLTFPPMKAVLPRWSPDGKQIAFMGQLPGRPWKIYLISANGGTPEQLLPGEQNEADPNWSPDGNSLVVGGAPWAGGGAPQATDIKILDLKTRRVSTVPGAEALFSPRWSPKGRYLIALPADSQKLVLYDFSTRKWEDLVNLPADYPTWSHDGDYVYFGNPGTSSGILRVRMSDRKVERMAELRGVRRAFGIFGPWFGLAPDDSLLLLRDRGSEEIYALDVKLP